jgi:transcription elongation factor Elf1
MAKVKTLKSKCPFCEKAVLVPAVNHNFYTRICDACEKQYGQTYPTFSTRLDQYGKRVR